MRSKTWDPIPLKYAWDPRSETLNRIQDPWPRIVSLGETRNIRPLKFKCDTNPETWKYSWEPTSDVQWDPIPWHLKLEVQGLWWLDQKLCLSFCSSKTYRIEQVFSTPQKFRKLSIFLHVKVYHFTNICWSFSTIQAILDEGKIICTRKSYYFLLSKTNIIITIEAIIWWKSLRSSPSAFQMINATIFFFFIYTITHLKQKNTITRYVNRERSIITSR